MLPLKLCTKVGQRVSSCFLSATGRQARNVFNGHCCSWLPIQDQSYVLISKGVIGRQLHSGINRWLVPDANIQNLSHLPGDALERVPPLSCLETQTIIRHGSTSGMSGSKTPVLGDVFSDENKERVMSCLSSKRTLRRFYTKDVKQRGAVLVPLCSVNREPCILFTLRTRTLKDHSGEVSFPGGKMDQSDGDVTYTALRELEEELGVSADSVEVWGNLSPVGREKITVVPVVGYLGEIDIHSLKYNPDEVSEVFVMTLSHLCSPASQAYTTFEPHSYSGQPTATLPVFVGGEHRVWGLTAYILDVALQAIVPEHYRSLVSQVKKEQAIS